MHTIVLDDYEVTNLRAAIEAAGYWMAADKLNIPNSPLMVLHTGDWLGQIYQKLPKVERLPNIDPAELAKRANAWAKVNPCR